MTDENYEPTPTELVVWRLTEQQYKQWRKDNPEEVIRLTEWLREKSPKLGELIEKHRHIL